MISFLLALNMSLFTVKVVCLLYVLGLALFRVIVRDWEVQDKRALPWPLLASATFVYGVFYQWPSKEKKALNEVEVSNVLTTALLLLSAMMTYKTMVVGRSFKRVSLQNKVAIVTGANTGLGLETARGLAQMGAHVIFACRSKERAESAMMNVQQSLDTPAKLSFIPLDLCDFQSVRDFVSEFKKMKIPLDILVNNAGIMLPRREVTSNGIEKTLAANHLGHFLLTNMLLPILKKSKDGRIVNVGSCAHKWLKTMYFDDLMLSNGYNLVRSYAQSKLANWLFTHELQKRLKETRVNAYCVHPGVVITQLSRNFPGILVYVYHAANFIISSFQRTAVQGAQTALYASTSPDLVQNGGAYLEDCRIVKPFGVRVVDADAIRLWSISASLTQWSNDLLDE